METSTNPEKKENSAGEHTQNIKETEDRKDNKYRKDNKDTFLSELSFLNLEETKPFLLKGIRKNNIGTFKSFCLAYNLKYSEFFELLLVSFAEANPKVMNRLTGQELEIKIKRLEPEEVLEIRDTNLDLTIKRFREALLKGKFDNIPQKLAYLDERARDTHLPISQRKEVLQLIADVREVVG